MKKHFAYIFLYVFLIIGLLFLKKHKSNSESVKRTALLVAVLSTFIGVCVKLYFALGPRAHYGDLEFISIWCDLIKNSGFKKLYNSNVFVNYPPGYMYVLYIFNIIFSAFNITYPSPRAVFVFKLPSVIADIFTALFIGKIAAQYLDKHAGYLLYSIMILSPVYTVNSSLWGQVDSIYTLVLIISLIMAHENKTGFAAFFYALALITKPQALLFGPVLLFYIIDRKSWTEFFKAIGIGIGTMLLLAAPFTSGLNFSWLIKLYFDTFGGYQYFTAYAFNIYMLLGLNTVQLSTFPFASVLNYVVIISCFLVSFYAFFRYSHSGKIIAHSYLFITTLFMFCTMMHERYIFPAVALSLLAYIITNDSKWMGIFTLTSVYAYMNIATTFEVRYGGYSLARYIQILNPVLGIIIFLFSLYIIFHPVATGNKLTYNYSKQ